jgi:hypothetical protein
MFRNFTVSFCLNTSPHTLQAIQNAQDANTLLRRGVFTPGENLLSVNERKGFLNLTLILLLAAIEALIQTIICFVAGYPGSYDDMQNDVW